MFCFVEYLFSYVFAHVCTYFFNSYMGSWGTKDIYLSLALTIYYQIAPQKVCTSVHSPQHYVQVPFSGNLKFFSKFINLMGEKYDLIVVIESLFKPGKQKVNNSNSWILKMKIPRLRDIN